MPTTTDPRTETLDSGRDVADAAGAARGEAEALIKKAPERLQPPDLEGDVVRSRDTWVGFWSRSDD